MKDFFNTIKESQLYEIIRDHSGLVIFFITIMGSLLATVFRVCDYFYVMGRYEAYSVPLNLMEMESLSVFQIIRTFAYIICFIGGLVISTCASLFANVGWSVAKVNYDLYQEKPAYIRRILSIVTGTFVFVIFLVLVNGIILVIAGAESKDLSISLIATLVFYQGYYGWKCAKSIEKKMSGEEALTNNENDDIKQPKRTDYSEEELVAQSRKIILTSKMFWMVQILLPIVIAVIAVVGCCIMNYNSGKKSAQSTEAFYQVMVVDNQEYVVLDKTKNNYIVAKKVLCEEPNSLYISISEQKVIAIEGITYENRRFDEIVIVNTN